MEKMRSILLSQFIKEIQYKNRNPKNIRVLEKMADKDTNPVRWLSSNDVFYRSRIITNDSEIGKEKDFYGYGKKDSFIPPIKKTRDARANYRYIPYLYCANCPYVSVLEVRPQLGSKVSVASIKAEKELEILDLTMQNTTKKMDPAKINLFSDLSNLYSNPVTSDDDILEYIPTQFIAEYVKNLGYDGIAYRSSLISKSVGQNRMGYSGVDVYNLVIFSYENCSPYKSNVVVVDNNSLEMMQVDTDSNRLNVANSFN